MPSTGTDAGPARDRTARDRTARPPMRWWAWLLVLVALAATLAVEVVTWFLVQFGGSCGYPVDRAGMRDGQLTLLGLWVLVTAPWALAAWWTRFRVPVVVAGSAVSLVALAMFGHELPTSAWTDGFCF